MNCVTPIPKSWSAGNNSIYKGINTPSPVDLAVTLRTLLAEGSIPPEGANMQRLARWDCPFHPDARIINIPLTMSDCFYDQRGKLRRVREEFTRQHCQECIWLWHDPKYPFVNNFCGFTYYGRSGGTYNADDLAHEGIALATADMSMGFNYFSTEVDVKIYKMTTHFSMNWAEIGKNPDKPLIKHFTIDYPNNVPRLVNLVTIYKAIQYPIFLNDTLENTIKKFAWV